MNTKLNKISSVLKNRTTHKAVYGAALVALLSGANAFAQEAPTDADVEVIEVSGIRSALTSALLEKRDASNLIEVIQADDIGKLPDQNLAEVLENVTGVQITRTAGVGTGVQIRGTNSNRVEINGVSTVGSGGGRNGIDFEDLSAAIISAVEITKSPEAKTTEGSVGGTVNLRTIRPLELSETLGSVRIQGEDSSLSVESTKPRFSAAYGDNWELDAGRFGFVISGSYTEQEAVSFRPRVDRDNIGTNSSGGEPSQFLGIQFLTQEQENDDYETTNIATTLEFAPNENMKFHFDAIITEQQQSRDQYRLQASGVSNLINVSVPTAFETVDFGTLGGNDLGSFEAAYTGLIDVSLENDADDPNLRTSSETGSRVTDTEVFVFGGEWQGDNLKVSAEISSSSSDTVNGKFETTVNFINPNSPIGSGNDNAVPFAYDFSGGTLAFGIASEAQSQFAPSSQELLTASNYVFEKLELGRNTQENSEDGFRVDAEYYVDDSIITSVDVGYRFSTSSSEFNRVNDSFSFSQMEDSPNGELFAELLIAGPNNFGDADGRDLFIKDFLIVDPDRSFSDREGTLAILYGALDAHRVLNPQADGTTRADTDLDENAFYLVEEDSHALYAQANFEYENIRGNFGARYVSTDVDSIGFGSAVNGVRSLETTSGDYDFFLPRINVVADLTDDIVIRMGYAADIRRPDFDNLNTGFNFNDNENTAVALGNPGLEPEEVKSFDVSVEWYFDEASVVSVGFFSKKRTNIFGTKTFGAAVFESDLTDSGLARETNPACPGGGIFNPLVRPNQLGDPDTTGLCVDFTQPGNDPESTRQSGFEFAFQYDLSSFEDDLGWASGFGFIGNLTLQDFHGGSIEDCTFSRGANVFGDDICAERGLEDLSETAYNATVYYEKHGVSARLRYTWRDSFVSTDFGGGSSTSSTLSFPVVTAARGQLNASVSYDVTENLNLGFEAVNLTEEGIEQYCVNDGALLCFVGLPDRRVTFGASYRF
jgi:TonB-dependent receptor